MIYYVQSSLAGVVKLLDDVHNFDAWVYKLAETKLVERINPQEYIYYNRMDFPWPLSDRDLIGYNKIWQDKTSKTVHVTVETNHWKQPDKEDIVRVTTLNIHWKLYPQKNGQVKVEYYLLSDPAGNIPAWLVNLALDQGPLETINNMRRELQKAHYQSASFPFIQELTQP